ncbi:MAG TPA: SET domain-containing protein-lysine N-methyltransferase [Ferruginibacter sp.]|nr:SET domain-containing protein-lysine N-methyltransferase [Ferruginibacter sp.]
MINVASNQPEIEVISHHGFAEKRKNVASRQYSLHSLQFFKSGDAISDFSAGQVFTVPNYLTVQTGINKHITLVPEFLQYINHSCDPNVFFDTTTMKVIALKDISVNEELTFFYPSTEWDMAQPFYCYCESRDCLQNIQGAKHISKNELKKYRLTDFIHQQIT